MRQHCTKVGGYGRIYSLVRMPDISFLSAPGEFECMTLPLPVLGILGTHTRCSEDQSRHDSRPFAKPTRHMPVSTDSVRVEFVQMWMVVRLSYSWPLSSFVLVIRNDTRQSATGDEKVKRQEDEKIDRHEGEEVEK